MAYGQALLDDLCGIIINMARQMDIASIVHYTGQKTHTVKQVLADYQHKGTAIHKNMTKELYGAK
jgi:hypothetical protein